MTRPPKPVNDDAVAVFIARVERLEKRFKRDRYTDAYLMPRDLMVAICERLKKEEEPLPPLFAAARKI